jgi:hypothetical protein
MPAESGHDLQPLFAGVGPFPVEPPLLQLAEPARLPHPVRKTLRDKRRPGMLVRRHPEVCVFSHLAAELRTGDIAVAGSDSYANLHAQMMTWEECQGEVADFCAQAGIPIDAKAMVAFYKKKLTEMAATVDEGYPANTDLRLEGGRPVLARRKGAERRPSAIALEGAVLDRLPDRSLLDILARSAHLTGWTPALRSGLRIRPEDPRRQAGPLRGYGVRLRWEPRPDRGRSAHARRVRARDLHRREQARRRRPDTPSVWRRHQRLRDPGRGADVGPRVGSGGRRVTDRDVGEQL